MDKSIRILITTAAVALAALSGSAASAQEAPGGTYETPGSGDQRASCSFTARHRPTYRQALDRCNTYRGASWSVKEHTDDRWVVTMWWAVPEQG